jgi:hypothetical protein
MLAEKPHGGAPHLSSDQEGSDPILGSGIAQITQAMVDFARATAYYEKALVIINRHGRHPVEYATVLGTPMAR